jgi:hypothetical protein
MADTKSRGGRKEAHEEQPAGKKHAAIHERTKRGTTTRRRDDARSGGARPRTKAGR